LKHFFHDILGTGIPYDRQSSITLFFNITNESSGSITHLGLRIEQQEHHKNRGVNSCSGRVSSSCSSSSTHRVTLAKSKVYINKFKLKHESTLIMAQPSVNHVTKVPLLKSCRRLVVALSSSTYDNG
jgi:hypothetical protein